MPLQTENDTIKRCGKIVFNSRIDKDGDFFFFTSSNNVYERYRLLKTDVFPSFFLLLDLDRSTTRCVNTHNIIH